MFYVSYTLIKLEVRKRNAKNYRVILRMPRDY